MLVNRDIDDSVHLFITQEEDSWLFTKNEDTLKLQLLTTNGHRTGVEANFDSRETAWLIDFLTGK